MLRAVRVTGLAVPRNVIEETMGNVPDEERDRIVGGDATRIFGIGSKSYGRVGSALSITSSVRRWSVRWCR